MDAGQVQVVCDTAAQLMPHLEAYGSQDPKDRTPEDDALIRKLRIAVGALNAALEHVARLTPLTMPPLPPPPSSTAS